MTERRFYLDHAATSPLRPAARAAMMAAWDRGPSNPASPHQEGLSAQAHLEESRASVAKLGGCRPDEIIFTASATEATNLAVRGVALARSQVRRVVSTRIEHSATRRACEMLAVAGWKIDLLAPNRTGCVDPGEISGDRGPISLVSIIAGHNEIGTLQPLSELIEAAHAVGAFVHLDAVQVAAYFDLSELPWDLLSLGAHKIGGPVGIGALAARRAVPIEPVLGGGNQEQGVRPGTVPVALAAGFAAAATAALEHRTSEAERLREHRREFAEALLERAAGVRPVGAWRDGPSIPHLASFALEELRGEDIVLAADEAGLAVGSSSACLGSRRSPVLDAIGVPESDGLLRVSFGWSTEVGTARPTAHALAGVIQALRQQSPFEQRRHAFLRHAAQDRVRLTDEHWDLAEAIFAFFQREGIMPGPRHLARTLPGAKDPAVLFPGGLATIAAWLGLPMPVGGCRPGV